MLSSLAGFMKEFRQIVLAPVVSVALAALVLYALGTVPDRLTPAPGKEYKSIEAATADMGFDIVVPVYFPNYLAWPPDKILGQTKPFPTVQMSFLASDRQTEILLTYQIISDSPDLPYSIPWIDIIEQQIPAAINDKEGQLIIGKRANGEEINAVHWKIDGQHFLLVTTQPVKELLKLARSMYINPH